MVNRIGRAGHRRTEPDWLHAETRLMSEAEASAATVLGLVGTPSRGPG